MMGGRGDPPQVRVESRRDCPQRGQGSPVVAAQFAQSGGKARRRLSHRLRSPAQSLSRDNCPRGRAPSAPAHGRECPQPELHELGGRRGRSRPAAVRRLSAACGRGCRGRGPRARRGHARFLALKELRSKSHRARIRREFAPAARFRRAPLRHRCGGQL